MRPIHKDSKYNKRHIILNYSSLENKLISPKINVNQLNPSIKRKKYFQSGTHLGSQKHDHSISNVKKETSK